MKELKQDAEDNSKVVALLLDDLESMVGSKPLYNELIKKALKIKSEVTPRVARCLN